MIRASVSIKQAEDQAIKWLARLNASDLSEQDEQAFMKWLAASPINQAAYLKAEQIWQQGAVLAELTDKEDKKSFFSEMLRFDSWQGVAVAFSLMLVCTCAFLLLKMTNNKEASYETLVGEQQEIHLEDGSQITINTDSKLSIVLEKERRFARLDQGEAFFEVSANPRRPFEVATPTGLVRVVGTQFSMRAINNDTVVTVLEGKVAVFGNNSAKLPDKNALLLQANESISIVAASRGEAPTRIDASTSLAWRNKQLIFRSETLRKVINELDRYLPQDLVLADTHLGEREITAVIKLDDLEKHAANSQNLAGLESLELSLNLRIRQQDANTLVFEQK